MTLPHAWVVRPTHLQPKTVVARRVDDHSYGYVMLTTGPYSRSGGSVSSMTDQVVRAFGRAFTSVMAVSVMRVPASRSCFDTHGARRPHGDKRPLNWKTHTG